MSIEHDIVAFSEEQVAKVTGLTKSQLAYWANSGFFTPKHVESAGSFRRIYSFRDVVGLRTVAALREQGVSMQELREVGEWLRREHDTPWSSLKFWLGGRSGKKGRRVYFSEPATGTPMTAGPPYQAGIPVALDEIVAQVRLASKALRQRSPESIGRVIRSRHVLRNAWILDGTRIPTAAVWEFAEDGADVDEILRAYPTLKKEDVEAAIAHERRLRRAS